MRTIHVLTSLATFASSALSIPLLISSRPTPDFQCAQEDIAETQCMGPKDCLYANPINCTKFIRCEVNADGSTGTPQTVNCPVGLKWNDEIKERDLFIGDEICIGV